MALELTPKRFELLKEVVGLSRAALLVTATDPAVARYVGLSSMAVGPLGVSVQPIEVRTPDDFEKAFSEISKKGLQGVVTSQDGLIYNEQPQMFRLALQHRLPLIAYSREMAVNGALISYGPNNAAMFRRAGTFVDKILKGTKGPGDLPVEQPTKFELVINMKTAKALGLDVSPMHFLRRRGDRMRRRTFIAALGGAAAWPLVARGQQSGSMRRVGIIMAGAEGNSLDTKNVLAFRDGMRSLGWVEDKNVRFDLRWQAAGRERAERGSRGTYSNLVRCHCGRNHTGVLALRRLPSDSPIVFVNLPDPVATGLVSTIARTNSNFTGFTAYEYSITGKWLEILKEIAPGVQRVGFVFGTATAPVGENFYRALEFKASSFNLQSIPISFADLSGLELSIGAFASQPNGGLILAAEGAAASNRAAVIKLAAEHHLPAVYPFRNTPAEGGLAFYGIDFVDLWAHADLCRRHSSRVRPADLPIQAPTKFELVINLKTAKALGLGVPPSLLARADEVIE